MKREGRQHGMVRAFPIAPPPWNPRSGPTRIVNCLDSRSTAGLFTRVPTKPTNHSKFTSRCGRRARCSGCHDAPACKAKDKAKGSQKTRASDLTMNHRLVAWTVGNGGRGFDFSRVSATAMLGHLDEFDRFDDEDEEDDENVADLVDYGLDYGFDDGSAQEQLGFGVAEVEIEEHEQVVFNGENDEHDDDDDDDDDDDEEEEEDAMSFCDVGFVMDDEIDGDGEWCVVGEL